ncbi:MAG: flavodoxin domain-containing protein [Pseudomonadota bacterium]
MKIALLYGTETGNAEILCEDIESNLSADHEVTVTNMEDTEPGALNGDAFHIFVCSTYGEGELPQSAIEFVDTMKADQTDLSAVSFSIFGLGDTSYDDTYNQGSQVLMDALLAAKAKMIGPRGIHDASGFDAPEEVAMPWVEERITEAAKIF